ncbi:hypothetical protein EVAR_38537_1 [Eumeta japonica]|uniref:Uncharacterized protein n=1 Tax=Eumeta variegata TaxID=151549 RepID=A0A4C1WDM3_EUMVA|nr:hypothetical protein EVAR_38537_1 [Eumeta japonica]
MSAHLKILSPALDRSPSIFKVMASSITPRQACAGAVSYDIRAFASWFRGICRKRMETSARQKLQSINAGAHAFVVRRLLSNKKKLIPFRNSICTATPGGRGAVGGRSRETMPPLFPPRTIRIAGDPGFEVTTIPSSPYTNPTRRPAVKLSRRARRRTADASVHGNNLMTLDIANRRDTRCEAARRNNIRNPAATRTPGRVSRVFALARRWNHYGRRGGRVPGAEARRVSHAGRHRARKCV